MSDMGEWIPFSTPEPPTPVDAGDTLVIDAETYTAMEVPPYGRVLGSILATLPRCIVRIMRRIGLIRRLRWVGPPHRMDGGSDD